MTECQTCGLIAPVFDDPTIAEEALRVEGWRVYDGTSLTGSVIRTRLCPGCGGGYRVPRPPKVLEGQDAFEFEP